MAASVTTQDSTYTNDGLTNELHRALRVSPSAAFLGGVMNAVTHFSQLASADAAHHHALQSSLRAEWAIVGPIVRFLRTAPLCSSDLLDSSSPSLGMSARISKFDRLTCSYSFNVDLWPNNGNIGGLLVDLIVYSSLSSFIGLGAIGYLSVRYAWRDGDAFSVSSWVASLLIPSQ